MSDFKIRFKLLRKKLKLSQKEMAKELGIPFTMISKYECGKIKPGTDMLTKIAITYKVNLNWLLLGIGKMFIDIQDIEDNHFEIIDNSDPDEVFLILEELSKAPITKEFVLKLIKAKRGDKKALTDIQKMIRGLEMIFE
ncbi:MAG: Transcriptional regulator [Thermodesulfobacterium sp.]|uniref:Transcriptional regulator n=1 Tax=Candidatus Thermodesulfobacterium syntrophicum TaxID=3060442 RepID=A0AAE3P585_9BACT|nr:Transcriptional regulator [Candidatus Thermodesulfobacterium syntrophicum]